MSEKNEGITNFDNVQASIQNEFGGNLVSQKDGNRLVITEKGRSETFIEAVDFGNHKTKFVFNPISIEKGTYKPIFSKNNVINILDAGYPSSVPEWKKKAGITKLYQQLFFSILNQGLSESAGGVTPGFFYSGISSKSISNPLDGKEHDQLLSFSAETVSLGTEEIADNPQYKNILGHIGTEIAKDAEILGVTQVEFESLLKNRKGRELEEKGKYVLLVVKGKFTLPTKQGEERVFHDQEEIKIVARKIEDRKITDDSEKLLSAITAFVAEANALKHPFRG